MLIISPPGPREAPNEETPDFLDYCVSIGKIEITVTKRFVQKNLQYFQENFKIFEDW